MHKPKFDHFRHVHRFAIPSDTVRRVVNQLIK